MAFQPGYGRDIAPRLTAKLGVLDVGAEGPSVVLELVNLSMEGALDVSDGAVGADGEAGGVGGQNGESVVLEFLAHDLLLRLSRCVLFEIGVGHPFVKGRRSVVVERVDGLVECGLVIKLEVDCDVDLGSWIGEAEVFRELNASRHIACYLRVGGRASPSKDRDQ